MEISPTWRLFVLPGDIDLTIDLVPNSWGQVAPRTLTVGDRRLTPSSQRSRRKRTRCRKGHPGLVPPSQPMQVTTSLRVPGGAAIQEAGLTWPDLRISRQPTPGRRTLRHTSHRRRSGRRTRRLTSSRVSPRRTPPHPIHLPTSRHGTTRRGGQPASRQPQPRRRTRLHPFRRTSPGQTLRHRTCPPLSRRGTPRRRTRRRTSCGTARGYL